MTAATREYTRLRAKGWLASNAWDAARTRTAWDAAEAQGLVRLRILSDEIMSLDDLAGDCFNPKANPDIPVSRLEREEKEFAERCERAGVWGVVGEYFDGETWQHGDSCWGFVGDDWKDSGTDTDIMAATLEALAAVEHCPTCGRPQKGTK